MNVPRAAVVAFALALLLIPGFSSGQQPAKIYRIGWLGTGAPAPNPSLHTATQLYDHPLAPKFSQDLI